MSTRCAIAIALLLLVMEQSVARSDEPLSGYHFLTPETRALQDDDFANPGMFWVAIGNDLWNEVPANGPSCASCHGPAETAMRGVGARYPAWSPSMGRVVSLEQRVNACRTQRQQEPAFAMESRPLLALSAFVMHQSRGLPMSVATDGPAAESYVRGRAYFETRRGQLNLSCANCHAERVGQRLRGEFISQGQVNGFPIYRQLWQDLGSVGRMIAWCNAAVRAEPRAADSQEYIDLELFLRARGNGLPIEAPAVRR